MGKLKEGLEYHLVDSTAAISVTTPLFAALETSIIGMSDEVSLNARLIAAGVTYGGLGFLIPKGRDLWRSYFNITDETKERKQQLHDTAYLMAINLPIAPSFYLVAGARDQIEITIGTLFALGFAATAGGPLGYTIDAFRDLAGIKPSKRLPEIIRGQTSKVKKALGVATVAGLLGLTAGIYAITPDKEEKAAEYLQPQPYFSTMNKME